MLKISASSPLHFSAADRVSATHAQAFHGSNDEASHWGISDMARRPGLCAKANVPDKLSPAAIKGETK
jgi:hypothetical protein